MEAHQRALVDQAIRHALTRYDDQQHLLRSSEDPRFRVVQESLAFAALLLARVASGARGGRSAQGRKTELGLARLLIDTILPLQNSTRRDPGRGAFPMVFLPDSARPQVMDPDSRELLGSLLGLLLKDHQAFLGEKRAATVLDAVRLTIRGRDQDPADSTWAKMIAAWLELEFGDQWRGERLATDVALTGAERLADLRFGDPRAYANELWALSLWRRSNRLHASVAGLMTSLREDLLRFAHPQVPELFGAMTAGAAGPETAYAALGSWLTWHAWGGVPLLPKDLEDPLASTCYAFPALARLKLPADAEPPAPEPLPRSLCQDLGGDHCTGWWEDQLHIEARQLQANASGGQRPPVVGARWLAPEGHAVWLRARVAGRASAVCRKRFVHFEDPGTTVVSVRNMGPGQTRMIDNGWWLAGLHFASEGFQMVDAERSETGLELTLKPTAAEPMLMFSPLP